jgi:imidazoleglycerol-phosphate dehydratase
VLLPRGIGGWAPETGSRSRQQASLLEHSRMRDPQLQARRAEVRRETRETKIHVALNLDGSGQSEVETGIGMFDHLLEQIARHGLFDLTVKAQGDIHRDAHHTVEDTGICVGQALNEALGDRAGIVRMAHAIVPLDEALALVAIDVGGRGYSVIELPFQGDRIGDLPVEMIEHFLQSLAFEARISLHVRLMAGVNDHHRAESAFKALARALAAATRIDPRLEGAIPSTKGTI